MHYTETNNVMYAVKTENSLWLNVKAPSHVTEVNQRWTFFGPRVTRLDAWLMPSKLRKQSTNGHV